MEEAILTNIHSLTINKENGRIAQRGITLYSQEDVDYLNNYLKTATGYNPGEQLTNKELEKKYLLLKQKKIQYQLTADI